jgi:hypothetical protein
VAISDIVEYVKTVEVDWTRIVAVEVISSVCSDEPGYAVSLRLAKGTAMSVVHADFELIAKCELITICAKRRFWQISCCVRDASMVRFCGKAAHMILLVVAEDA